MRHVHEREACSSRPPDSVGTVQEILNVLDEYAMEITNETYESFVFRQRKQEEGKSFDNFYSSPRDLSKTCNFCRDSLIRDQTVTGTRDHDTKQYLLKVKNLTLKRSIVIYRATEKASVLSQGMGIVEVHVM